MRDVMSGNLFHHRSKRSYLLSIGVRQWSYTQPVRLQPSTWIIIALLFMHILKLTLGTKLHITGYQYGAIYLPKLISVNMIITPHITATQCQLSADRVTLADLRSQLRFDWTWNSGIWHAEEATGRCAAGEPIACGQPLHQWYEVLLQVLGRV